MAKTQQYDTRTYHKFNKNKAIIKDCDKGIYHCYLINTKGELLYKFEPKS